MGQTNRETLNNLLDRLESSKTGTVPDKSILEVDPAAERKTDYDASWTPCDTGNIAEKVKQAARHNEIEVPTSTSPSPREIAQFLPVVKGWPTIKHPDLAGQPADISIDELTSDYQRFEEVQENVESNCLDRLKLGASLLEDHNIPWIISEIYVEREELQSKHAPVLEVGVPNNNPDYEQEFLQGLRDSYLTSRGRGQASYLVSTISRSGFDFYPVESESRFLVQLPGVFKMDETVASETGIQRYLHTGVIKESL